MFLYKFIIMTLPPHTYTLQSPFLALTITWTIWLSRWMLSENGPPPPPPPPSLVSNAISLARSPSSTHSHISSFYYFSSIFACLPLCFYICRKTTSVEFFSYRSLLTSTRFCYVKIAQHNIKRFVLRRCYAHTACTQKTLWRFVQAWTRTKQENLRAHGVKCNLFTRKFSFPTNIGEMIEWWGWWP